MKAGLGAGGWGLGLARPLSRTWGDGRIRMPALCHTPEGQFLPGDRFARRVPWWR